MDNKYYERLSEMNPGDLADGLAIEAEFNAIAQAFGKLPTPHTGGQGFDGPVRVGDAKNNDEAVNLGQLQAAIGEAVLLDIATYGNLAAAAWGTLPSNTYLLFGTGSQFSNSPYNLVASSTYYLQVRHVIGGVDVNIYHDQLSLASSDDASNVDLRRLFERTGSTFANANAGGWAGFVLKKAALTALEPLTPAADQIFYYTGGTEAALTKLTAFMRTLLDDPDALGGRSTLQAPWNNGGNTANMDLDSLTQSGFHRLGPTPVGGPAGVSYAYGQLIVSHPSADTIAQILITYLDCRVFIRSGAPSVIGGAGSYTKWTEIYTQARVVGSVSQSGGIPTGALFEFISTANGACLKFPDGTMICWALRSFTYGSSAHLQNTWTLPVPHAGGFAISMTMAQLTDTSIRKFNRAAASGGGSTSAAVTSAVLRLWATSGDTFAAGETADGIPCLFIGRWYV